VFFYALDEDGLSAKAMPSYLAAMPGEQVACIGCHEDRTQTGPAGRNTLPMAFLRPPSNIEPVGGVPRIFDYVRDIQPLWDRHCVACHNYESNAGNVILQGDMTPSYSLSFYELKRPRSGREPFIACDPGYEPDPYSTGSGGSRLLNMLKQGHQDVELSKLEMAKLKRWADAGTTFAGTYAALNSVVRSQRISLPSEDVNATLSKRCYECHKPKQRNRYWLEGEIRDVGHVYNVTRPEKSLLLMAPLSKAAGGLGLCRKTDERPVDGPHDAVFADAKDPDYVLLLEFARSVQAQYGQPRWFQARHRPADWYVREMKRFGVLPETFNPATDALNGYEVDARYFRLIYEQGPGPVDELLRDEGTPQLSGRP
jgi:hypothetical protein